MGRKAKTSKRSAPPKKQSAAEAEFVEKLIVRGDAVSPSSGKALPPGATHLIVTEEGERKAKRVRFSAR